MVTKKRIHISIFTCYFLFVLVSYLLNWGPGYSIGRNFMNYAMTLLKIVPVAFILIGLFEVWVKKETIEKHLGEASGVKGYVWAILLASTTIGGIFVSLPVSQSLYRKGASLRIIFTYITASTIARIPMSIFEASFLGVKFTAIRFLVSLPLVILSSILMEKTASDLVFESEQSMDSNKKEE